MAALTSIIAAAGLGLTAAGSYMAYKGQQTQAKYQQQAIGLQQEAEAERKKQMNLEAMRRRREIIRQALAARSMALATATNQGASGGSALGGAYGQISGREGTSILGVNQNQEIGNNLFGINQSILGAYRGASQAGASAAMGSGLASLGGALLKNEGSINRIGTYAFGKMGFA
jgi:hypothetical protein